MLPTFKNVIFNLINHKETNVIATALLIFLSIYIGLLAIFNRNPTDPLEGANKPEYLNLINETSTNPEQVPSLFFYERPISNLSYVLTNNATYNFTRQKIAEVVQEQVKVAKEQAKVAQEQAEVAQEQAEVARKQAEVARKQAEVVRYGVSETNTIMSLFFLWIVALCFGRFASYAYLPPLLGMLLAGILIRNVGLFSDFWQIHYDWDQVLRQFAFILILIRCGFNLDPEILRHSLASFACLGLLPVLAEAAAIFCIAHFVFEISVATSFLFGFILTATSPAVVIPTIIRLQNQGYGKQQGIPTMVLASVGIDNILCITAFTIVGSMVFTANEDFVYLIVRIPVEILVGALLGILIGLLLRIFPRSDVAMVHFVRSVFICSSSAAVLFGTAAIGCYMAGPVSVLLLCIISSMRWKIDNHQATQKEEHCYRILWSVIFQPFLFGLIGLLFDFSQMSWDIFWSALIIIFIGCSIRFVFVFLMSFFMNFEFKDKLFLSLCFLPKGSVQIIGDNLLLLWAALAPLIFEYQGFDSSPQQTQTIFQICVFSILVTAPVGQIIIDTMGKLLLSKQVDLVKRNMDPLPLPSLPSPNFSNTMDNKEPAFLISDVDNRLRLKVNGKPSKTMPITSIPNTKFEEINQQAFEIFKEQRLKNIKNDGDKIADELTAIRSLPTLKEVSSTKASPKSLTKF